MQANDENATVCRSLLVPLFQRILSGVDCASASPPLTAVTALSVDAALRAFKTFSAHDSATDIRAYVPSRKLVHIKQFLNETANPPAPTDADQTNLLTDCALLATAAAASQSSTAKIDLDTIAAAKA